MPDVIILVGLPASGKSTFAKQFILDNPSWVRINKDTLRLEIGGNDSWYKKEKLVFKRERELIKESIDNGINVVIDNTHLNPKTLNDTKDFVESCGGNIVKVIYFDVEVEEAIRRDKERGSASVGAHVIKNMYNTWIKSGKVSKSDFSSE